jgi:hypothetical protein
MKGRYADGMRRYKDASEFENSKIRNSRMILRLKGDASKDFRNSLPTSGPNQTLIAPASELVKVVPDENKKDSCFRSNSS